jgi:hypothetical protein
VVEVRTGLPYSNFDVLQNYVGMANSQRFGVYTINLTNHLNALAVYSNVASPLFGEFAGFQHRVDGLVIDLVD